jgi:hypothetical protein
MMDKISLTNIVFKEVAKVVVLAWINNLYDAEPRITELFFSSSEFGTLFEVLGQARVMIWTSWQIGHPICQL